MVIRNWNPFQFGLQGIRAQNYFFFTSLIPKSVFSQLGISGNNFNRFPNVNFSSLFGPIIGNLTSRKISLPGKNTVINGSGRKKGWQLRKGLGKNLFFLIIKRLGRLVENIFQLQKKPFFSNFKLQFILGILGKLRNYLNVKGIRNISLL